MKIAYIILILSIALNISLLIVLTHIRRVYHMMIRKSLREEKTKDELVEKVSYDEATITNDQERTLLKYIQQSMEKDKLYLHSDLDMQSLAKSVGTNKATLSHVINNCLHQNFATFLNRYRVREAIQLMSDDQYASYKIEAIGEMCGYSNRQMFHAAFKKEMGITPTHFRNINKKR